MEMPSLRDLFAGMYIPWVEAQGYRMSSLRDLFARGMSPWVETQGYRMSSLRDYRTIVLF